MKSTRSQLYRAPDLGVFDKQTKMSKSTWDKQVHEMEKVVKEVEGEDDRVYEPETKKSR